MKKDKLIQIKIESQLAEKLKAVCIADGMTVSQKIRLAIRKMVNRHNNSKRGINEFLH